LGWCCPELQNAIFPALAEVAGGGLAQQGFTTVLCVRGAGGLSEASCSHRYAAKEFDSFVTPSIYCRHGF
jgi:hypothetical protein